MKVLANERQAKYGTACEETYFLPFLFTFRWMIRVLTYQRHMSCGHQQYLLVYASVASFSRYSGTKH